jgi:hypothetical protein
MEVFRIDNKNKVVPTAEILVVEPFKTIWENNDKQLALLKFAYIEFMSSYKKSNPFIGYNNEVRSDKILENITTPNKAKLIVADELVFQAINKYKELEIDGSPSISFYEAALNAAEKLTTFFNNLDITKIGPKGYPLYKPADVTRALKDTNEVIKTLGSMKEKVMQELTEAAKGKSGREINYFEKTKNER